MMGLIIAMMEEPEGSDARRTIQTQIDTIKRDVAWLDNLPPKMLNKRSKK
jgi:hypothetical protein